MERRFQLLPPEAGILFISVRPDPVLGGLCNKFTIFLGLYRSRIADTNTGVALAKRVLEKEIQQGMFSFSISVYRGLAGAARDEDPEEPRRPSA